MVHAMAPLERAISAPLERAMSFGRGRSYTEDSASAASSLNDIPVPMDGEGGLSGFGGDEVYEPQRGKLKRHTSCEMKRAVQNLEYSEVELELLADDTRQFRALKNSLRNKGAITNEVLKQKLPLLLKYKNDRLAQTNPEAAQAIRKCPSRSLSGSRKNIPVVTQVERNSHLLPVNRVLSEEETYEAGGAASATVAASSMLGRIIRPGAKTSSSRRVPTRTKSSTL